jgi:hypothetical protein
VQSDRTKLPHRGDREKNILKSLAFLKEARRTLIKPGTHSLSKRALVSWIISSNENGFPDRLAEKLRAKFFSSIGPSWIKFLMLYSLF